MRHSQGGQTSRVYPNAVARDFSNGSTPMPPASARTLEPMYAELRQPPRASVPLALFFWNGKTVRPAQRVAPLTLIVDIPGRP